MTWLHLSVPALIVAALWASWRASVCFGAAGGMYGKQGRRGGLAFVSWLHGEGYRALTLFCAVAGGFVWGRIL